MPKQKNYCIIMLIIASAGVQKDKSLRKIKLCLFKVHFAAAAAQKILKTEEIFKTEKVLKTENSSKKMASTMGKVMLARKGSDNGHGWLCP